MRASERPVDEDTRIDITQMLRDFQASDETELVCPPVRPGNVRALRLLFAPIRQCKLRC